MKFLSESLSPLVKVLLSCAILMICFSLSALVMSIATISAPQWATSTSGMVVLQAIGTICVFGSAYLASRTLLSSSDYEIFHIEKAKKEHLIWAIALPIAAIPCVEWLNEWNNTWHFEWDTAFRELQTANEDLAMRLLKSETAIGLIGRAIAMAIVPAFCEELWFRGIFLRICSQWLKNPIAGSVLCSLIFSLVHFELFAFAPRFLLSMILCWQFLSGKGGIWYCILSHFINNFLVCLSHSEIFGSQNPVSWIENTSSHSALSVISSTIILLIFFIRTGKTIVKHTKPNRKAK